VRSPGAVHDASLPPGHGELPPWNVAELARARGQRGRDATAQNLERWREWLRYVHVDQLWVWGVFCFLGMFLNVNLATAVIPHGTDLQGLAAGAYQAEYLADLPWSTGASCRPRSDPRPGV